MTPLNVVLSVADHFATVSKANQIAPVHLFLALLTLELVNERDSSTNDDEENQISQLLSALDIDDLDFFTNDETANGLFCSQAVPRPKNSELLRIIAKSKTLPISLEAQNVLDCAASLNKTVNQAILELTFIALATIGSHDAAIDRILREANVERNTLAKDIVNIDCLCYKAADLIPVANSIFQALLNNGFEHSIPKMIIGLSHRKNGILLRNALISTLILGNEIGEVCNPAIFTINWAYSIVLGLVLVKDHPTDSASIIEQLQANARSLQGKKAIGKLATALTSLFDSLPLPATV